MKSTVRLVFLLILLAGVSLACMAATNLLLGTPTPAPTPIPPATATATPMPLPSPTSGCASGDCITACMTQLQAIVPEGGPETSRNTLRRLFASGEEYVLVTYSINGDQISDATYNQVPQSLQVYQKDASAQENIWDYFAAIIPENQRTFLKHFIVTTDGKDNVLAAVSQSDTSAYEWDLSVDMLDASDPQDLTFTLVHEFGHLLTLNSQQVQPSLAVFNDPNSDAVYTREEQACPRYFTGEGCSDPDSYINTFFDKFWIKIYDEWSKIDAETDDDIYQQRLDRFYAKYKDQFVSDYAVTDPEEDIAETWAYFVLYPKPTGNTIANQKVLFFYGYPELVSLRKQIANNLCAQLK